MKSVKMSAPSPKSIGARRGGSVEHFYDLTDFGRVCLKLAEVLEPKIDRRQSVMGATDRM
jgi:hypothetical protein